MTPPEHEHTEAVTLAARWLAGEPDTAGRAIVPELRQRFGLTTVEACAAIRQAQDIRRARG